MIERDSPPSSRWVQATGYVDEIELRISGAGVDPRRSLRARHTLVTLSGPVGGPYGAVLVRDQKKEHELFAGHLLGATSQGVWVHYLADAADIRAEVEQVSQGEPAPSPDAAESSEPAPELEQDKPGRSARGGAGWAALARAAAREHGASESEGFTPPQRGDRVRHFSLGLCDVLSCDGERLRIRDAQGPGRIRELRLSLLELSPPVIRDGKRVFGLSRKD